MAGRVVVDGRPARLGDRLSGSERVVINGKRFNWPRHGAETRQQHLLYYKPAGELTSRADPENRRTVFEQLPEPSSGRWISVGRLDIATSGLMIFTTDGELAHRLMHPSYRVKRRYAVRLLGTLSDAQMQSLLTGVTLDDGPASFDEVKFNGGGGCNVWYEVALQEGRNREVRRIFDALGVPVSRLIRIRYGPVQLSGLRRGQYRRPTASEIRALYQAVDLLHPGS